MISRISTMGGPYGYGNVAAVSGPDNYRFARDRTGSVQRRQLHRSADGRELLVPEEKAGGLDVLL
jgi:hypothetical protein